MPRPYKILAMIVWTQRRQCRVDDHYEFPVYQASARPAAAPAAPDWNKTGSLVEPAPPRHTLPFQQERIISGLTSFLPGPD
ncbi:hypothetical protein PoB_001451100 [Plakobranchus ocellatus]|uniref:Uncharacterized protein n=1 Tax=Plakobranchus ocellatus TaxID=259542 RepID=A0AAV3YWY5_9GAST|nr:hypothetical protein PoB_001451100 [Plakobranchus ocellatus]